MIISEEVENAEVSSGEAAVQLQSPSETPTTSPNKSFERKNSFLGKLFSSKKNKVWVG